MERQQMFKSIPNLSRFVVITTVTMVIVMCFYYVRLSKNLLEELFT